MRLKRKLTRCGEHVRTAELVGLERFSCDYLQIDFKKDKQHFNGAIAEVKIM